jgi:hypothetical protein
MIIKYTHIIEQAKLPSNSPKLNTQPHVIKTKATKQTNKQKANYPALTASARAALILGLELQRT